MLEQCFRYLFISTGPLSNMNGRSGKICCDHSENAPVAEGLAAPENATVVPQSGQDPGHCGTNNRA